MTAKKVKLVPALVRLDSRPHNPTRGGGGKSLRPCDRRDPSNSERVLPEKTFFGTRVQLHS
jgi:hypothetical protein